MMSIHNLALFCQLVLKKKQILTSIKGRNSVANLRKTKIYNINVDLVNDNVYSKFGLNLSIRLKILSRNQILTSIKGRNCCKFAKNNDLHYKRRSCQLLCVYKNWS